MLFHSLIKAIRKKIKKNPGIPPANPTKALIKLRAKIENFLIIMQ